MNVKNWEQPHAAEEEEENNSTWEVERTSCKQMSLVAYKVRLLLHMDWVLALCTGWNFTNNVTFLPEAVPKEAYKTCGSEQ